jgi:hypothetical protein
LFQQAPLISSGQQRRHFAPWPLLFVFGGAVGILSAQAPPATAVTELTAANHVFVTNRAIASVTLERLCF